MIFKFNQIGCPAFKAHLRSVCGPLHTRPLWSCGRCHFMAEWCEMYLDQALVSTDVVLPVYLAFVYNYCLGFCAAVSFGLNPVLHQ